MTKDILNAVLASEIDLPAFVVGDHLALDFLNTIAAPKGDDIEWLGTGADFLQWLVTVDAITSDEYKAVTQKWSSSEIDMVASEARDLREWFREVVSRVKSQGRGALMLCDIEALNDLLILEKNERFIQPGQGCEPVSLATRRVWLEPRALLAPLATAMAYLLVDGDFELIRDCCNEPCALWFYDRTKGNHRKYCSPAVCGNRAKVAAYRERQKTGQSDS